MDQSIQLATSQRVLVGVHVGINLIVDELKHRIASCTVKQNSMKIGGGEHGPVLVSTAIGRT
jgi:hypothetical protein